MKKIFFFSIVLIIIFSLSLSVLAAESFTYTFTDSYPIFYNPPLPGIYRYHFFINTGDTSFNFTGLTTVYFFNDGDEEYPYWVYQIPFSFVLSNRAYAFNFFLTPNYDEFDEIDGYFGILQDENYNHLFWPGSVLTLTPLTSPSFSESVNSGLSSVIDWVQSFSLAFLSGELSPLLSVFVLGICIAALFLAVRFIYKICWGC